MDPSQRQRMVIRHQHPSYNWRPKLPSSRILGALLKLNYRGDPTSTSFYVTSVKVSQNVTSLKTQANHGSSIGPYTDSASLAQVLTTRLRNGQMSGLRLLLEPPLTSSFAERSRPCWRSSTLRAVSGEDPDKWPISSPLTQLFLPSL